MNFSYIKNKKQKEKIDKIKKVGKAIVITCVALYLLTCIFMVVREFCLLEGQKTGKEWSVNVVKAQELTNEEKIRQISRQEGFEWEDYLVRLAYCENDTLNPERKNDKDNHPFWSIDRGVFMINDYWHAEVSDECAYDLRCSTLWAIKRINSGYQHEWVCNKLIK